jgi:ceramide glucosyltransferase
VALRTPGLPPPAGMGDNSRVLLCWIFGALALLSAVIGVWQFVAARRFPLHRRVTDTSFTPGVTLLKPLKGCDAHTRDCLRSWFAQDYAGPVQILFAVQDAADPVCEIVRSLQAEFPQADTRLEIVTHLLGANAKVSKLAHLESLVTREVVVISDADVKVPADLLTNLVEPLRDPQVGLVNCFYRLANPTTAAMRWEAVAINADFWSQVLQSRTLKPQDFALGAVMAVPMVRLNCIGGFHALVDYLADDYQLGNRIAKQGYRVELCPVVVECWDAPMNWRQVWAHQLRWARTIRVCQPGPFAASILSNGSLWPLVFGLAGGRSLTVWISVAALLTIRESLSRLLRRRFGGDPWRDFGMARTDTSSACLKDLLGVAIWFAAFFGHLVVWRGVTYRVGRDGKLTRLK